MNVTQSKHRTQDRDEHGKTKEMKPTDRSKNNGRAKGTEYGQPQQSQARKTATKGQGTV